MNQRTIQKIETRKKIYDCALELFLERSFDEVKVTDIVKKAGVSVGTFYYHFPSKDDIIDEGYRQFDGSLKQLWEEEKPAPGKEAIRFLIWNQIQEVLNLGMELTSVFFKNQLGIEHNYYFNDTRFLYQKLYENVLYIVSSDQKALLATEGILRVSRGTIYDWCMRRGNYDLMQVGMEDVQIFMNHYLRNQNDVV